MNARLSISMPRTQKGFTLIELMIVVAIVAVLTAIAIPTYRNYLARAQMTESLSLVDGVKTEVAEYWSSNGAWPTEAQLGIDNAAHPIHGKYVANVRVSGAAGGAAPHMIIATLANAAPVNAAVRGATLALTATLPVAGDATGSIGWTCAAQDSKGGKLSASYLPSACR